MPLLFAILVATNIKAVMVPKFLRLSNILSVLARDVVVRKELSNFSGRSR